MRQGALLEAYQQHREDLLGFLTRRLRCHFTAADLLQELYLRLVQAENQGPVLNRRAYLYRMAANLATDHIRVESRRREILEQNHQPEDLLETRGPERNCMADETLRRLQDALQDLPERSRHIFFANRFEGKTQQQIAKELGVSTTTVENHIRRVFEHLAKIRDQR
ncbi:sigma-70 family RNA polymerase sigma factor [Alcanivorax xiamenensis]|uniref:Sigma-70 family RNA polymerase sigma factor n=1 Tax=Alcanivorax xiamenensis TaxID=1177156 RepID=A0ABQ6Y3K1_9GAMM|nr:RNA polymerase sigma factor [Alcanivorax xiamenensis]KAF0803482.1 sigma-70 family RNA polymerase sigma factor [Alcanivorax xiamenensis]